MCLRRLLFTLLALSFPFTLVAACGDDDAGAGADAAPGPARAYFDLSADLSQPADFWNLPFPSDLRLTADGKPDLAGYPIRDVALFHQLRDIAAERPGFPVMPVAYFRFDGELAPRQLGDVVAASVDSPVLLVDVDPDSPARGALVPTVVQTLGIDDWAPPHLLAVAPRPGFVLVAGRTYAVVVRRSLNDAAGRPLDVPDAIATLAAGDTPAGTRGADAAALYAPMWDTLDTLGVARAEVATATVFTTGDVVADTAAIADGLNAAHQATLSALALDPDDGADHPRYCELHATLSMPNFQEGEEPYDTLGHFVAGPDGLPTLQKTLELPMVISVPKAPMPDAGYPLLLYVHGSGGLAAQVVDRGYTSTPGGLEAKGEGPAHVVAPYGFASAGTAMPANPERVPGASDIEYINFGNLGAFPSTFREGVIEQRLFISALLSLSIPPAALAGCTGPSLPAGQTEFHFDAGQLYGMGQSMGGMYINMLGAAEPRFRALIPTGAGGFWSAMILESSMFASLLGFLPVIAGTDQVLTFAHPALHLIELGWEPADPFVYMPRLSRRPLPGHPVLPVYEPVGDPDHFFSTNIYDAAALAYGNQQVGSEVWPTMQPALALDGLDGIAAYPVEQNLVSDDGTAYTGVVVQYAGDGIIDGHNIAFQLDEVKYQYGCFLATMLASGVAVVPAPAPLGTPCPSPQ